jgi:hypothetical protein
LLLIPSKTETPHNPQLAHALQVCIARDASMMVDNRVFAITLPANHIITHRHADTLGISQILFAPGFL